MTTFTILLNHFMLFRCFQLEMKIRLSILKLYGYKLSENLAVVRFKVYKELTALAPRISPVRGLDENE